MTVPPSVTIISSGPGVTVTESGPTVTVVAQTPVVTVSSTGAQSVVAATAPATYNAATQTVGVAVGTTAGTAAAGNDSRIVGALQAANNLSDVASAAAARTSLGLGGAATENVGTTSGTVAAGNDSRIVGALQAANNLSDVASATAAYNALAPEFLVTRTGTPATDASAINSAISAASAAGGGRVRLGNGAWVLSSSITPQSNVTLCGQPGTTVAINFTGDIVYGSTVAFTNFTVEDLTFLGPVNSFPSTPTRARTTSGPGAQTAVYLSGDLDSTGSGQAQLTNFVFRRCTVQNCSALPLRIGGVRGEVLVYDCTFTNCQDVGFIYNQSVRFENNFVQQSADNGVSVSRGNNKCTVVGNVFENCCYNGIWLSGFDDGSHSLADIGPTNFSCTGNTVINVGFNGIMLDQAPANGVVTGNMVNQNYNRGPSDQPSDANGSGVYIGGYPTSSRGAPTAYATNLVVAGNTLFQCARAGVYVTGAKAVTVEANQILDVGTQFLADGVTAILSTDATQNVGILIDNTSTNTDLAIRNNTILDERATPYGNYALVPQNAPSSYVYWFNHMAGLRNPYNLLDHDPNTREIASTVRFDANAKFAGGATAGTSGGTGTISGFDINGAAGSARRHQILTGSVARWAAGGTGDAESGGNAGTNWVLNAYSDAGTFLYSAITVARNTGIVSLSSPLPVASGGTGSTTQNWVSLAGDLGNTVTNPQVTSTHLSSPLPVAQGGTGSATQTFVNLAGDLGNTVTSPQVTSTHLASALPINQGGTGSTTQNFVDLSTSQTVGGQKNFTSAPRLVGVLDSNAATVLGITATPSAVNFVSVQNNTSGNRPALVAGGTDTDVGITVKTKGAGSVNMHPSTDSTTFLQVNNAAGTTTVLDVDTSNTRVGIGKTNPGTALDVAGTMTGTGLAMTTSPTAGYALTSDSAGNATWQAVGSNGVTPVHTGFTAFGTGGMINTLNVSSGASVTMVAGTIYWAAVPIPFSVTLTGVIVSVGTVGGTDLWIGAMCDSTGKLVANSALAGTTAGSANTKMKLAFTSSATVLGPSVYYILLQSNGSTAKFLGFNNGLEGFVTGSATGTFGTLPTITPGTTYTAGVGPFANTY